MKIIHACVILLVSVPLVSAQTQAPLAPARDQNTPRQFPAVSTRAEWERRAEQIREQILVSCGLWPMPPKTPLHPHVFGRVERDGYSIEKVYLETLPGFYLAGNLYRPLGHGRGPFPAVLNPHGHWPAGRLTDIPDASIPARCIAFARQGIIAFSYDLVGYNDTRFADTPASWSFSQAHHAFATNATDQLWNISLMGLQTWNSIRALDFLESLPEADHRRLGCTGASGGGTQTFILGAIDPRLAVQAPVNMVSHIMQGGCLCENAPGLRVEFSNVEIAAAAAPRPQFLVAATGDWTRDTPEVEGPEIASVYALFNKKANFAYQQFPFGHNYNQTSREAVYAWFGKWLLKSPAGCKETSYEKELDKNLRVFPDGRLPEGALTVEQVLAEIRDRDQARLASMMPTSRAGWAAFKKTMFPAWRHTLQLDWPGAQVQSEELNSAGGPLTCRVRLVGASEPARTAGVYWAPAKVISQSRPRLVVLADWGLSAEGANDTPDPGSLAEKLLQGGMAVLAVHLPGTNGVPDQLAGFYTTYNRTCLQQGVRDLVALCAGAQRIDPRRRLPFRVTLIGQGRAGLLALLAAPAADAVIADCCQLDATDERALLAPDLFCPGLLAMGGFEGAALLAGPHWLLLHNTGLKFPIAVLKTAYSAAGQERRFRGEEALSPDSELVRWVAESRI